MTRDDVPSPDCPLALRVNANVPMAHVVDVDHSARFYALLGYACDSRFAGADGVANWCALSSGQARLFLVRATGKPVAEQQGVLFYMYSADVRGLRAHLLAHGIADGGTPPGEGGTWQRTVDEGAAVFTVVPRFFMPSGELRVHDPDGYVILIGQLG